MSLGSVPNFKSVTHKQSSDSMLSYQQCVSILLEDIRRINQTRAGVLWMEYRDGMYYMTRPIPYVLSVLGDSPRLNKYATKYNSGACYHPCCYCDICRDHLDDHSVASLPVTRKKVVEWKCTGKASNQSYHVAECEFDELCFGGDDRGIHGSSPGELGHAFQAGIVVLIVNGLFFSRKLSKEGAAADKVLREAKRLAEEQQQCRRR